jgi:hypothetical protein
VTFHVLWLIELCEDRFCEHLAELDTHLVWDCVRNSWWVMEECYALTEGVDTPDDALHKDLVLVQSDQRT